MGRSEDRAARNELVFREANERLVAARADFEPSARTPFICECEDERCSELVQLTADEYTGVRSAPARFFVALGHDVTDGEIIEQNERFCVVEKRGRARDVVLGGDG